LYRYESEGDLTVFSVLDLVFGFETTKETASVIVQWL